MSEHDVLIVDEPSPLREQIASRLSAAGMAVECAATGASARERLAARRVDCVVSEYRSPGIDGLALARELSAEGVPVVLFTDEGDETVASEAIAAGANDYVPRSGVAALDRLADGVERAIDRGCTGPPRVSEVVERLTDGFFALDTDWRFTYLNDPLVDLLGESRENLLGESIWDVIPEAVDSKFDRRYREAMDSQEPVTFEAHVPEAESLDGIEDRWYEVHAYPSRDGLSVYFQDVTEEKRAEQRHDDLFESWPDAVALFDREGQYLTVNQTMADSVGLPRDELEGTTLHDHFAEELADRRLAGGLAAIERNERVIDEDDRDGRHFHNIYVAVDEGTYQVISREITDRRSRERELQTRVSQQEAVTDLGQLALSERDLDALFDEVTERVAGVLDVDYCKVLELLAGGESVLLRSGVGWRDGLVGDATVDTGLNSQAGYTLRTEEPVIVEDLATEARFSGPELLTSHDVTSGVSTVVGTPDDPWGVLGVHDTNRRGFSDHDVTFVRSVATILATAIERAERERELERQRDELETLDRINAVIRDINHELVKADSRETIERVVCERLADSEPYLFAWVGEPDVANRRVEPRTSAGKGDGYLDDVTVTFDDSSSEMGPAGRAIHSGETQVVLEIEQVREPWQRRACERGFQSIAAIPLAYGDSLYGVLCVYAGRSHAFDDRETAVLTELGETVAYAINAVESKRALVTEPATELVLSNRDSESFFVDASRRLDCRIALEGATESAGGELVEFCAVSGCDPDDVLELAAADDGIERARLVSQGSKADRFEFVYSGQSILTTLADYGAKVRSLSAEGGTSHIVVELPHDVNVRRVVEAFETAYPESELLAQREANGSADHERSLRERVDDRLTDRQLASLEAAHFGGFFDWPRGSTGEQLAASLDISAPTFHQHLRAAERKLASAYLDERDL